MKQELKWLMLWLMKPGWR